MKASWEHFADKNFIRAQQDGAKERLIDEHLPLVRSIAQKIHRRLPPGVDLASLFHSGVVALLEALDRFDPKRGVKFEVYARFRVHGEIMECLRSLDWVHRSLRSWGRKIEQARAKLIGQLVREPTAEEIAKELHISLRHYFRLDQRLSEARLMSIDQISATSTLEWEIVDPQFAPSSDPRDWVEKKDLERKLAMAVEALPERQRRVVRLRYNEERPFREIAQELGVSEARVCQILADAVARLRFALDGSRDTRDEFKSSPRKRRAAGGYWKAAPAPWQSAGRARRKRACGDQRPALAL